MPSVLEAALALVDEWYEETEKTDSDGSSSPSSVASSRPRQKRSREELTALRSSVPQLQHVIARHWPKKRTELKQQGDTASTSDAALNNRRVHARRVLHAIHTYSHVQAVTRFALNVVETVKMRPFDNERMVDTLRSRLDALTTAKRFTTNSPVHEQSDSPTLTHAGLQIQSRSSHYVTHTSVFVVVNEIVCDRRGLLRGESLQHITMKQIV